jgi:hypothetical protein
MSPVKLSRRFMWHGVKMYIVITAVNWVRHHWLCPVHWAFTSFRRHVTPEILIYTCHVLPSEIQSIPVANHQDVYRSSSGWPPSHVDSEAQYSEPYWQTCAMLYRVAMELPCRDSRLVYFQLSWEKNYLVFKFNATCSSSGWIVLHNQRLFL